MRGGTPRLGMRTKVFSKCLKSGPGHKALAPRLISFVYSYVMPSILLWNLTKKLPTTDTEFLNIVYVKHPIARASKDELLKLIEDGRKEGSKNFRDRLQTMLDAQQVDRDIEMAEPDQGSESDATVVGTPRTKIELARPSSTLWNLTAGKLAAE